MCGGQRATLGQFLPPCLRQDFRCFTFYTRLSSCEFPEDPLVSAPISLRMLGLQNAPSCLDLTRPPGTSTLIVRITQQTLLLPGFTTVCMLAILTERLHYVMAGKTEAETNQETHWNHATPKRQGLNVGPLGLEFSHCTFKITRTTTATTRSPVKMF